MKWNNYKEKIPKEEKELLVYFENEPYKGYAVVYAKKVQDKIILVDRSFEAPILKDIVKYWAYLPEGEPV